MVLVFGKATVLDLLKVELWASHFARVLELQQLLR